jgi:hypothetical protein
MSAFKKAGAKRPHFTRASGFLIIFLVSIEGLFFGSDYFSFEVFKVDWKMFLGFGF